MKRKLVISNIFILFISLVAMLIGSNIIVSNTIENKAKKEITNYLNIALNIFDGTNLQLTAQTIVNNSEEIRITFIDVVSYEVLYDYYRIDDDLVYEQHNNRPELLNLGKIYIRNSQTLNVKMMYIAGVKDGVYVRIAIPLSNLSSLKNTYMLYAFIVWAIISVVSSIVTVGINKLAIKPINQELRKLAAVVDDTNVHEVDLDLLHVEVLKTCTLIESKIQAITQEKEKLNYVINSINQGFIVLDQDLNIYLINNSARKLFGVFDIELEGKGIIYLCQDHFIIDDIKRALDSEATFSAEHIILNRHYFITFSHLKDSWDIGKTGVSLTIMDMNSVSQVEMMKKDFFANASHELKTPLTTIIGNLQMIDKGIVEDEALLKELITKSEKEAKRIASMVTDMLELSYLENGEKTDISLIDLAPIIVDTIKKLEYLIKEKEIIVNIDIDSYYVDINPSDAQYLISNLIDNAVKYNKTQGKINISLKNDSFVVADDGIGIPADAIDRIFERFYRVDKSRSRELGGTGLGLSIVKHICNKYHYDINVISELSVGTTFTIRFKK